MLDYSEIVGDAVEKRITEDSKLKYYEISSDNNIMSHVACTAQKNTRNFEKCPKNDGESLVIDQI